MPGMSHQQRGPARLPAAAISAALELGLVALVWFGLAPPQYRPALRRDSLSAVTLDPVKPPEPVKPPPPSHHHTSAGKAAPAALRAHAAPVYAPLVPLAPPPPMPVAPIVAQGNQAHNGASTVPGPGSGAGGIGNGTGSGAGGNGDGNGGSDPEWSGGKIKSSDYPLAARQALAQGTTSVTIAVDAKGHPAGCRVTHSSRNPSLDSTTCALVLQRFRFRPARDAAGHAVSGEVDYDQEWTLGVLSDVR